MMMRARILGLDWRFFLSLSLLLMSSYLVWVGVSAVQERERLATENTVLREDNAAATVERKVLLLKQNELLDQVAGLQKQYDALIDYLRDQNIDVPDRLATLSSTPKTKSSSGGGSPPKAQPNPKAPDVKKKPKGSKKSCKKCSSLQLASLPTLPTRSTTYSRSFHE